MAITIGYRIQQLIREGYLTSTQQGVFLNHKGLAVLSAYADAKITKPAKVTREQLRQELEKSPVKRIDHAK